MEVDRLCLLRKDLWSGGIMTGRGLETGRLFLADEGVVGERVCSGVRDAV